MLDILLVAILPVIVAVVAISMIRSRRARKPKNVKVDHQTRRERSVWAWATVVASTSEPAESGRQARVRMQLEVHTPGTPPYQATTTWLVEADALAYVAAGKEISLKVDPLDLKYVYPNGPWAKYVE
jgi:hypothetical protein